MTWCVLVSTFALFSAVCWRLLATPRPHHTIACRVRWAIYGALHIAVAVAALSLLLTYWGEPRPGEWQACVIRFGVAFILLFRWGNRRADR